MQWVQKFANFAKRRPVLAASAALCIKYSIADYGTQTMQAKVQEDMKKKFDWKRFSLFATFGAYYGSVNYAVFRAISRIPWPSRLAGAIGMTFIDAFVHLPLFFLPQFYFARSIFLEEKVPSSFDDLTMCFMQASSQYSANFQDDLLTTVTFWVPVDMIMFGFLPLHLRTPFLSCIAIVYPILLSWKRGVLKTAESRTTKP